MPSSAPVPSAPSTTTKPTSQTAPVVRPWIPPQAEQKPSTRDPRLNRPGPPSAPQPKEPSAEKKSDVVTPGNLAVAPEKSGRPDKARTPRKEVLEEKSKSKSPSPMSKNSSNKTKQTEAETQKSSDPKKDPRLKKRSHEKTNTKDEVKDKKRSSEKERQEDARGGETQRSTKGRVVNGTATKHEHDESTEKADLKSGGNARTHARKRPHSRSRSRSPGNSPKRKERRSPKSRIRSTSLSPPSHKTNKARRPRPEDTVHGKSGREDRLMVKKNQSEARRSKRPTEERHTESRENHSPRSHDGGGKENKDAPHRWRSGWEENKQ